MVKGTEYYQLNNCYDCTDTVIDQLNCSCGQLDSIPAIPECDTDEERLKPYCLNKLNSNICNAEPSQKLYKCTNANMDSDNFIYYRYVDKTALALIEDVGRAYTEITPKKNNFLSWFGLLIIGIIILLLLYLFNKNRKI